MTIGLLLAAAAAAAQPSAEAIDLARQVASHGALAQLAPLQTRSEIENMIRSHPELTESERQRLRTIGEQHSQSLIDAALNADAKAFSL